MEPATMTTKTASAYLGISLRTLTRLIQRGELPIVRLGGRVLLRREALETFLREHETLIERDHDA
jgi:excisionase family DNA binding protein